jgi:hypothetical protein
MNRVKCCKEIGYEHKYNFRMKRNFNVNNYKHGEMCQENLKYSESVGLQAEIMHKMDHWIYNYDLTTFVYPEVTAWTLWSKHH